MYIAGTGLAGMPEATPGIHTFQCEALVSLLLLDLLGAFLVTFLRVPIILLVCVNAAPTCTCPCQQ